MGAGVVGWVVAAVAEKIIFHSFGHPGFWVVTFVKDTRSQPTKFLGELNVMSNSRGHVLCEGNINIHLKSMGFPHHQ